MSENGIESPEKFEAAGPPLVSGESEKSRPWKVPNPRWRLPHGSPDLDGCLQKEGPKSVRTLISKRLKFSHGTFRCIGEVKLLCRWASRPHSRRLERCMLRVWSCFQIACRSNFLKHQISNESSMQASFQAAWAAPRWHSDMFFWGFFLIPLQHFFHASILKKRVHF